MVDENGEYVCKLYDLKLILPTVYIPPPYNVEVFHQLIPFAEVSHLSSILVIGDFNSALDLGIDRCPAPRYLSAESLSLLSGFCRELGLQDVWRRLHPDESAYTCFS